MPRLFGIIRTKAYVKPAREVKDIGDRGYRDNDAVVDFEEWIFYRPLLAVALLAIAGGIVYLVWKKRRAAKQA